MEVQAIRPTQFAVGYREVAHKRKKLEAKTSSDLKEYLKDHPIEGVLGPNGEFYATDGHHLGRAATEIGLKKVCVKVLKDYSHLALPDFWKKLDEKGYSYLYLRGQGPYPAFLLPRHFHQMADDPHRSLASAAKRAGAFLKSKLHYSEFFWANFFRKYITFGDSDAEFLEAVELAVVFARSEMASHLPGFIPDATDSCTLNLKTKPKR